MKHNLTPEQIVMVLFGLLFVLSMLMIWIDDLKKKYYRKGYAHGWNRAKSTFGKGFTK
jgi:hypothetical protein